MRTSWPLWAVCLFTVTVVASATNEYRNASILQSSSAASNYSRSNGVDLLGTVGLARPVWSSKSMIAIGELASQGLDWYRASSSVSPNTTGLQAIQAVEANNPTLGAPVVTSGVDRANTSDTPAWTDLAPNLTKSLLANQTWPLTSNSTLAPTGSGYAYASSCDSSKYYYDQSTSLWEMVSSHYHTFRTCTTATGLEGRMTRTLFEPDITTSCKGATRILHGVSTGESVITYPAVQSWCYDNSWVTPYPAAAPLCSFSENDCGSLWTAYDSATKSASTAISSASGVMIRSPMCIEKRPSLYCTACTITAEIASIVFWPPDVIGDVCDPGRSYVTRGPTIEGQPNTFITGSTTLTSPSVYVLISIARAYSGNWYENRCGPLVPGPTLLPVPEQGLSSIRWDFTTLGPQTGDEPIWPEYSSSPGSHYPVDYNDFLGLVPADAWNGTQYNFPYELNMIDANSYFPTLEILEDLRGLDPLWASCALGTLGMADPPTALLPVRTLTALGSASTTQSFSLTTYGPKAEPSSTPLQVFPGSTSMPSPPISSIPTLSSRRTEESALLPSSLHSTFQPSHTSDATPGDPLSNEEDESQIGPSSPVPIPSTSSGNQIPASVIVSITVEVLSTASFSEQLKTVVPTASTAVISRVTSQTAVITAFPLDRSAVLVDFGTSAVRIENGYTVVIAGTTVFVLPDGGGVVFKDALTTSTAVFAPVACGTSATPFLMSINATDGTTFAVAIVSGNLVIKDASGTSITLHDGEVARLQDHEFRIANNGSALMVDGRIAADLDTNRDSAPVTTIEASGRIFKLSAQRNSIELSNGKEKVSLLRGAMAMFDGQIFSVASDGTFVVVNGVTERLGHTASATAPEKNISVVMSVARGHSQDSFTGSNDTDLATGTAATGAKLSETQILGSATVDIGEVSNSAAGSSRTDTSTASRSAADLLGFIASGFLCILLQGRI